MISAEIVLSGETFLAELSDGRFIASSLVESLARDLAIAGVRAEAVTFGWYPGVRMMTAGQKVAILSDLRTCGSEQGILGCA